MIVFDASFLVVMLQEKAPPIYDRANKPVGKAQERVNTLLKRLSASGALICIPTPALAEVMVRAGKAGPEYLKRLGNHSRFRLTPFDVRAAIEAADLIRILKDEHPAQSADTWNKVKFDIQIVSIAKAESCPTIYSEDNGLENLAKRVSIDVRRICDLPVAEEETPSLFESEGDGDGAKA